MHAGVVERKNERSIVPINCRDFNINGHEADINSGFSSAHNKVWAEDAKPITA